MLGIIVNTVAIIMGTLIGVWLKKGLKEQYQSALFTAMGFAATALGIQAIAQNMPKSEAPVLFIASLAIGGLVGTVLRIDERFQAIVGYFGQSQLAKGLSTAVLLFCIGTLSILGPVESALYQNHTYLFTNATLDLVTSMVLATTYGIGIMAAAGILFIWQSSIYFTAKYVEPYLTTSLMTEVSIIGGILILASGLSILGIRETKTLNLLPALLVPVIWFAIQAIIR